MNGVHDMGGMHGFGPVEPEPDEPVFHAEWERRAFALTLAMGATGQWNARRRALRPRGLAAPARTSRAPTTRCGSPGSSACSPSAGS